MRLKVAFPLAAAVLGLAALASPASAAHCGACTTPCSVANPNSAVCRRSSYRVCYRTVEEEQPCVCYRQVYHTVMKECRSVCYKPVYEQHVCEQHYTVCKPVYEDYDVVRKYTVCHPVYEQHVAQRCYTVCKPVYAGVQVPVHYCTYRPVYEQHVAQRCYTVCHPVYQEYEVPVSYCTYRPVYEQHVDAALLHRLPPGVPGLPGARPRTRTCKPVYEQHVAQRCYTVCNPVYQEYEVPVHYTTCKPVYEQHTCEVPETCYRTVQEQRQYCYKTCTCEPVYDRQVRQGLHRLLRDGADVLPRPGRQHKCCRLPGTASSIPAPAPAHYCPGPTVNYEVQCPGHTSAARSGCRTRKSAPSAAATTCTHEQLHTGCYTVCHLEPYTVMRQQLLHHLPHGFGRPLHAASSRCRCTMVPEQKVECIPYTTCHMVAGAPLLHGATAAAATWSRSRRWSASPTPPATWSPSSTATWSRRRAARWCRSRRWSASRTPPATWSPEEHCTHGQADAAASWSRSRRWSASRTPPARWCRRRRRKW